MSPRYVVVCAALLGSVAGAQDRSAIRQLPAPIARSAEPVAAAAIRPLPSGVLVNEPSRRRVVMFDSRLAGYTIVADTTPETGNAYADRFGGLIAYRGDSSLFIDPASLSMLLIDPTGKVARVMAVPRTEHAYLLARPTGGATYDGRGGFVYRAMPLPQFRRGARNARVPAPPEIPDSAALLRIDLATRRLDTLAFLKTPKVRLEVTRSGEGNVSMRSQINPLPVVDEWATLPDGTVAIVRGRDYHVDWLEPSGGMTSSPKVPFDWQRLTDEDKVAFIDSLRAARERMASAGPRRTNTQVTFVDPSDLPDYKPAFFTGAVHVDTEGNLWVRTIPTRPLAGGPVYDVVNRKGELVERVQIPKDRTIIGFGPDNTVYMTARESGKSYLEKASLQ